MTLELALSRTPTVVAYKIPKVEEFFARRLIKVSMVAQPNIILGEMAFPELLQDEANAVALAERLELLLSIYAKGERPSGSSDPYALRRAGNGLLQILWERGWRLDLERLLQRATGHWADWQLVYPRAPRRLWHLFHNAPVNLALNHQNLVDHLAADINDLAEGADVRDCVSYQLVARLARSALPPQTAAYQFELRLETPQDHETLCMLQSPVLPA